MRSRETAGPFGPALIWFAPSQARASGRKSGSRWSKRLVQSSVSTTPTDTTLPSEPPSALVELEPRDFGSAGVASHDVIVDVE
jgi:hypothetical protein